MSRAQGSAPPEAAWVYNEHNNDLGDWCPYSGEPFDGQWDTAEQDVEAQGCPQNCRSSWLDEAPGDTLTPAPGAPGLEQQTAPPAHPSPGL